MVWGRAKDASPFGKRRRNVQDVAALARVSPATVSNVLNRPDLVNPATAARVRQAIEDLGMSATPRLANSVRARAGP